MAVFCAPDSQICSVFSSILPHCNNVSVGVSLCCGLVPLAILHVVCLVQLSLAVFGRNCSINMCRYGYVHGWELRVFTLPSWTPPNLLKILVSAKVS